MTSDPTTPTRSAVETLREAARLLRERAGKATPGRWHMGEQHGRDISDEGWSEVVVFSDALPARRSGYPGGVLAFTAIPMGDNDTEAQADAEHIASWHPAVALAVADWLDDAANEQANVEAYYAKFFDRERPEWARQTPALAVARAYLEEDR